LGLSRNNSVDSAVLRRFAAKLILSSTSCFGNAYPVFLCNGESVPIFQPVCGSTCIAAAENSHPSSLSYPGKNTAFSRVFATQSGHATRNSAGDRMVGLDDWRGICHLQHVPFYFADLKGIESIK
jgi:hypothetical protein